ncbi:Hypothetical predicted protein [Pelobates cultripes]|uniref:Uncharacterized protein n=1 Tax=Pelobates cultripes TaxID=61616 RepID=A0AAD1W2Q3_PELCU|nr:Hypothetical predicted protein [Pelobates cultripes]
MADSHQLQGHPSDYIEIFLQRLEAHFNAFWTKLEAKTAASQMQTPGEQDSVNECMEEERGDKEAQSSDTRLVEISEGAHSQDTASVWDSDSKRGAWVKPPNKPGCIEGAVLLLLF